MILGLIEPVTADYYAHGPGDRYGAAVVRYSLVHAALAHGTIDEAQCFVPGSSYGALSNADAPGWRADREKLSIRPIRSLPAAVDDREYVFLTHGLDFQRLGQVRLGLSASRFPISALMHSLNMPTMLTTYVMAALFWRSFDAIIATSRAGARAIERLWDDAVDVIHRTLGVTLDDGPRIVHIPLGVDVAALTPRDRRESRAILKLPPDRLILTYVGRLTMREKANLSLVIDALAHWLSQGLPVHLVLAGASPRTPVEAEEVLTQASRPDVAAHVTLMRDFPPFAKPLILSSADVFVSPADNVQETFGLGVAEAAAAGLPSIVSDWSGYRDIVVDGETGFLIPTTWPHPVAEALSVTAPLEDATDTRFDLARATTIDREAFIRALGTLLAEPELRVRMGAAARARATREFSWDVVLPRFRRLWDTQIEGMRHAAVVPTVTQSYSAAFGHFATRSDARASAATSNLARRSTA